MKKLLLLAFICLSFATSVSAQTGWYMETTKFDKYIPDPTGTVNMQFRYNKVGNIFLDYERTIENTVTITIYDYDAVGNPINTINLYMHKDANNDYKNRYIVDKIRHRVFEYDAADNLTKRIETKNLDAQEFKEVVQKIMDRLDQK